MERLSSFVGVGQGTPVAVTIGHFDGVHVGHRVVLRRLMEVSTSQGLKSLVLCFDENPKLGARSAQLMTQKETFQTLEDLGIDFALNLHFEAVKPMTYDEFLEVLFSNLNVKAFVGGEKLRIGKDRLGTIDKIRRHIERRFPRTRIEVLPSVGAEEPVSSTKIRRLVEQGDVKSANQLLQSRFQIEGRVVSGKRLGSQIGFPTMNLPYPSQKIKPKDGVYTSLTHIDGHAYRSLTFVGRPMNAKKNGCLVESHLFNFSKTRYNEPIRIEFLRFLRERKTFETTEALRQALQEDMEAGLRYFDRGCLGGGLPYD